MKKLLFISLILLTSVHLLQAQKISQTFFVNDWANMLTEQEEQLLEKKIKAYQDSTSTQIAIVLMKSLNGENLEELSLSIANDWGIGQKRKNNGILILVALDERKVRIEVGKGLNDRIDNRAATDIIKTKIRPSFRQKKYYEGLNLAVNRLIGLSSGKFRAYRTHFWDVVFVIAFVFWLFMFIGSRRSQRPALELGVALLGLSALEIYWGFSHPKWYISLSIDLAWAVLWLLAFVIRERITRYRALKALIGRFVNRVDIKSWEQQFIPAEIKAKIEDWNTQTRRASLKTLRQIQKEQREVMISPEKYFAKRPDIELIKLQKKLVESSRQGYKTLEQNKFGDWLLENFQEDYGGLKTYNLSKWSEEAKQKSAHYQQIYQPLYEFIRLVQDDMLDKNLRSQKFASAKQKEINNQITKLLKAFPKKQPSSLSDKEIEDIGILNTQLQAVKKTPEEVLGYDYHRLLVALLKFLNFDNQKSKANTQELEKHLSGRVKNVENHQAWKQLKQKVADKKVEKLRKQLVMDYTDWDKTVDPGVKLDRLARIYNNYIERSLEKHPYLRPDRPSSYKSSSYGYGSTSKKSSSSSYYDNDYGSSSSGSSWGGGSFDGDGGSGDW